MLILSRKVGEEIVLPTCDVVLTVVMVRGQTVKLGITAPPETPVHRQEVAERLAAEDCQSQSLSHRAICVLIADRRQDAISRCARALPMRGFRVLAAASALECVEQLRRHHPDVLVLSHDLPWGGADGVLAMMREQPDVPQVPVLLLSPEQSISRPDGRRDARHLQYLSPADLARQIRRRLSARRIEAKSCLVEAGLT